MTPQRMMLLNAARSIRTATLILAMVSVNSVMAQEGDAVMGPDAEPAPRVLAPQVAGSRAPSVTVLQRQGNAPVVVRSSARLGGHDPLQIRTLGDGLYGFTYDDGPITGVPRVLVRPTTDSNQDFRRIRGDDRPARFRNRAVLTIDRTSRPYEETVEPRYRYARTVTAASMLPEGTAVESSAAEAGSSLPASILRPLPEADAAWANLQDGKPLVALDAFITLCAVAPDDARVRLGYALSAEASGQRGRAAWAMGRALTQDPQVTNDLPESVAALADAIRQRMEASAARGAASDRPVAEVAAESAATDGVAPDEAAAADTPTVETLK